MKIGKNLLNFLLASALIFASSNLNYLTLSAQVQNVAETNLALNKQIEASSVEAAMPDNTAQKANDNDLNTRWSTSGMKTGTPADSATQNAQWLVIDLGEDSYISEISVDFYLKVWSTKYRIETSDTNSADAKWIRVAEVERASSDVNAVKDVFAATSNGASNQLVLKRRGLKRYVRFYFEKVNPKAGGTGVSVKEITIKGVKLSEAVAVEMATGKTASASTVENEVPQNTADKAFDGKMDTRWSCNAMKQNGATDQSTQTPQWLMVDLGNNEVLASQIQVAFHMKVWATKYRIETADTSGATKWDVVQEVNRASENTTTNNDRIDTFDFPSKKVLKRYVRFYFEKVNVHAAGTGVSVKDINIKGLAIGSSETGTQPEKPQQGETNLPTYHKDFKENINGLEKLYGGNIQISADSNSGAQVVFPASNEKQAVYDKNAPEVADGIFETTIVPKQNVGRFGLIFRASDASHQIYVGLENNNNKWFWEYWNGSQNQWSSNQIQNPAFEQNKKYKLKVELKGLQVKFFVNDQQVFAQKLGNHAPLGKGKFGFVKYSSAGTYVIEDIKIWEHTSASSVLHSLNFATSIDATTTTYPLPEVKEGYEVKVIGSSKEQLVSNNGTISTHFLGEKQVTLLVECTNREKTEKARRNITVTLADRSNAFPEAMRPVVNTPNAKPNVLPTLQEWYGGTGSFKLSAKSKIVYNDSANLGLASVAQHMQKDIKAITGFNLTVQAGTSASANDIYLQTQTSDTYNVGKEGYVAQIGADGIKIYAPTKVGCLYGSVSIEQMLWLDEGNNQVPYGLVRDYPDYEIRGVMFDVARIPHRYQYLKDYTNILTWYKMNEFHLHLNDDYHYTPDATANNWNIWSGMHRLESDVFPSLTKHRPYPNNDYYNNEYAEPVYTKQQYRELEDQANALGIKVLAEFDTPSHATAYSNYAKENPDHIDWLNGPIHREKSYPGTLLEINKNTANGERARKFISELYKDYLGGNNPTFKNDTVHVGCDEYWDKSDKENFREYTNFLIDLIHSYGKTVRMWGAQKMFAGTTKINPENVVLDVWATYEEDPIARMDEGFKVVNVPQPYLYVTPGRDHKDAISEEAVFKYWNPLIFNGAEAAMAGEPLLLGAKTALWGDEYREGITETDLHERMLRAVAITAEKTWGGQSGQTSQDYLQYQYAFEHLAEGPNTQIAHKVVSKTDQVVNYDMTSTNDKDTITLKDASGNGYDATIKNGSIVTVDGKKMVKFDGTTEMTTPIQTLGYPYTVSFDVKATSGNTKNSLLFSGYDGQLKACDQNGNMTIKRSLFTQDTKVTLPSDKVSNITIVGNMEYTEIYVDGKLVKLLHKVSDPGDRNQHGADEFYTTFVFPMETIGKNFHGYIGNVKAYNKTYTPQMIKDLQTNGAYKNIALNKECYAVRNTNNADYSAAFKRHPAFKATDGSTSALDSYWVSSKHNEDYLFTDLEQVEDIHRIVVKWHNDQYAKSFKVLTSNDMKTWTEVKSVTNNTTATSTVELEAPIQARFVKVQGVARNGNRSYAIAELEVYQKVTIVQPEQPQCTHDDTRVEGAKAATCTEKGSSGKTVCTKCGHVVKEAKELAALGHDLTTPTRVEPTCTKAGTETTTCSRCDHKVEKILPATGKHTYGEWKVVTPATTEKVGLEKRACTQCGHEEEREIAKLPETEKPGTPLIPLEPSTPVKPESKPEQKPENKPNKDETGTGDVTSMSVLATMVTISGASVLGLIRQRKKQ